MPCMCSPNCPTCTPSWRFECARCGKAYSEDEYDDHMVEWYNIDLCVDCDSEVKKQIETELEAYWPTREHEVRWIGPEFNAIIYDCTQEELDNFAHNAENITDCLGAGFGEVILAHNQRKYLEAEVRDLRETLKYATEQSLQAFLTFARAKEKATRERFYAEMRSHDEIVRRTTYNLEYSRANLQRLREQDEKQKEQIEAKAKRESETEVQKALTVLVQATLPEVKSEIAILRAALDSEFSYKTPEWLATYEALQIASFAKLVKEERDGQV